ncbi:MAG: hypothetical protein K5648_10655 [Erysipelotrichaceae bacterium]|nr:hypothetical protein [Erysipelotrichaceae bacterium]
MANKTLSKLKRDELLNLLYEQEKRIEELETKNKELQAQLDDRHIRISKVGSIADASLALTGIFKEAQKAAELYLQNVQGIVREKQTDKYVFPAKTNEQPKPVSPPQNTPAAQAQVKPAATAPAKPAAQPQTKPAAEPKPTAPVQVQAKRAKQTAAVKPVTQKHVAQNKAAVPVKDSANVPTADIPVHQVKPAAQKPAYVGRHSKGGNGDKK